MVYIIFGIFFWAIVAGLLILTRPGSFLHKDSVGMKDFALTAGRVLVTLVVIAAMLVPMWSSPYWNGEIKGHRAQYEEAAENYLEGHLDLRFDDDSKEFLDSLENPYDYQARRAAKGYYHFDHAYYNGNYYMYFGIAPVIFLFLPFRAITGVSLPTVVGTAILAVIFILGVFALFNRIAKRFFHKMPFGLYLTMSATVSVISIWYGSMCPAMYCTAIIAGLAASVWCIYGFFRAVYVEDKESRQILFAALGAFCGITILACRPPMVLVNLIAVPMVVEYIRKKIKAKAMNWKLILKMALAALPYVIGLALIMWHNAARFDDPFEFGQRWQLTIADQTNYSFLNNFNLLNEIMGFLTYFFGITTMKDTFPFVAASGVFVNFPILLLGPLGLIMPKVRERIRKSGLMWVIVALLAVPLLIVFIDVLYSPYILERYRMDTYFIQGLLMFISIGFCSRYVERKKLFNGLISMAGVLAMVYCLFLFLNPYDSNAAQAVDGFLENFEKVMTFGIAP